MGEEAFALHFTKVFLHCLCYRATLTKLSAVSTLGSFSLVPGRKKAQGQVTSLLNCSGHLGAQAPHLPEGCPCCLSV